MRNIKLLISFNGSGFSGSQVQDDRRTVQGEIETAIHKLTGKRARLVLAGRTDAGVHALSQAANFRTSSGIPARKFAEALNTKLAGDLRVIGSAEARASFDARASARRREYLYLLYNGKDLPVMFQGRAAHVKRPLDVKKMSDAARLFMGRHDFFNFSARDVAQRAFRRRVFGLRVGTLSGDLIRECGYEGHLIVFRIEADAFLYRMVRFIVGSLIETGSGRIGAGDIKAMLAPTEALGRARKTAKKSALAPSCGLYLSNVKY